VLTLRVQKHIFVGMHGKVSIRQNPIAKAPVGYNRSLESCRSKYGRVSHRTLLNAGCKDNLQADQPNYNTQKISTTSGRSTCSATLNRNICFVIIDPEK